MTPTLLGVSTGARLMHDGRYSSLSEPLKRSRMGRASELTDDERSAMIAYLATL